MGLKVNQYGKILFRHPHVLKGKYGKVICLAVAKLTGEEQGRTKDCLEALLEAKPLIPSDFKGKADKVALEAYFDPMKIKPPSLKGEDVPDRTPEERFQNLEARSSTSLINSSHMNSLLITAQQKNAEQEATIIALRKALGDRSEEEKALTLWECYFHAYFHLPMREGAKNTGRFTILRRAGAVLEALGLDRPYASITKDEVIQAVTDSGADSDFERYARKQSIKRVFSFLCKPENEDGLGFSTNPAANMVVGSISTIQKKKQGRGEIEIIDPLPFLDKLQTYEKAMTACLAFAGLRLAECAALTWELVDFKNQIIRMRATEHYPELKNFHSYRDIRPFQNLWPILRELKALKLHDVLCFPRQYQPSAIKRKRTRETWFDLHHGDIKVIELSNYFRDRLEDQTGLKFQESARRMRRFWETTMRAKGLGHLIGPMGAHENKVGLAHYTEFKTVVEASVIPKI